MFVCQFIQAQQSDAQKILSNTHGLIQGNARYYEVEGYSVMVKKEIESLDEHGVFILKNRYEIEKENKPYEDTTIHIKNRVFYYTSKPNKTTSYIIAYYFIETAEKEVTVVSFATPCRRDKKMEQSFVTMVLDGSIKVTEQIPTNKDSINFAGKYKYLKYDCNWTNPHCIQCPYKGEINWSECRTMGRATEITATQKASIETKWMGKIVEELDTVVFFEGKETLILKAKYKIKMPKLLVGGDNVLIVYFITQEIRGKFISCVMSHYESHVLPNGQLPALIREFIKPTKD